MRRRDISLSYSRSRCALTAKLFGLRMNRLTADSSWVAILDLGSTWSMAMVLRTVGCKGWCRSTMYGSSYGARGIIAGSGDVPWWWFGFKTDALATGRGGKGSSAGGWVRPLFWCGCLEIHPRATLQCAVSRNRNELSISLASSL